MLVVVGALREAVLRPLQPSSESSEAALLAEVMVMEFVDVCEGMAGGVVLLVAAGNPLAGVDMQLYLAVVEAEGMGENPKVGEIINLSLFVKEEVSVDVLHDPMAWCHHSLYPLSVCLSVCVSVCVSVSVCLCPSVCMSVGCRMEQSCWRSTVCSGVGMARACLCVHQTA